MITYTPFDAPSSSSPDSPLPGNPLDGKFGPVNVGHAERYGSIVGGTALVAAGLSRRNIPGLLLAAIGGLFVARGLGGHCKLYDTLGVTTTGAPARRRDHSGHRLERTILIARPPADLFRFWRNLENLPQFMENIQSISVIDERHSHWVVRGPAGHNVAWDAEIVNEHPGEMISWQTLPGSEVHSAGTVRFNPVDGGKSTLLRVVLEFRPPGGELGTHLSRLLGQNPATQLENDLNRLKQIIESHDIPAATNGQSHPA